MSTELLKKAEKIATSSDVAETIVNIFKAILSSTPFCGGLASLITDYIPSRRIKRLEEFAEKIATDLSAVAERVDKERFQTDDFAFVFEQCFRGVAENPQKEKIDAFRGILINSAIDNDLNQEEREFFLNLVNTLSVLHIRILKFMVDPLKYLEEVNISPSRIQGGFAQFFPVAIPGIQLDVIKSAFEDLYRYALITTDKSIFGTMTAGKGLELLDNRVSQLGRRFIQFCISPT